jgi:hypothetical protein
MRFHRYFRRRALEPLAGMVARYSHHVGGGHVYGIRIVAIHMELLRESRLKKPKVPDARGSAIERQKAIMWRKGITLVNPDGFCHLAREWRVLR